MLREFGEKRHKQDYLAYLQSEGVTFAVGSDCHSARYDIDIAKAAAMLDTVGIRDEDIWRLSPRMNPLVEVKNEDKNIARNDAECATESMAKNRTA